MIYLKQSTASQSVLIGPFVDDTDGKTAETGLTIANTDIRLSKNGGNMAAKNSGGGTHDEAGWYTITLDATDTNTVGRLQISVDVAGALPVWLECHVLEEAIYDALFGASAAGFDSNGRVDVGSFGGTSVTARDIGASVLVSSGTGTGQISLSSGKVTLADGVAHGGSTATLQLGSSSGSAFVVESSAALSPAVRFSGTAASNLGLLVQSNNSGGDIGADIIGSLSGSVGSVTGNVGGNVTGSVGSISGVTFPSNFSDMAITATTGKVTVGTNDDKTGYSLTAVTGLGNQTADITGNLSGSVGSVVGAVGSVTAGVTLADGVAHGGSTATLRLGSTTGNALHLSSGSGNAMFCSSTSGAGIYLQSGDAGLYAEGNGAGIFATSLGGVSIGAPAGVTGNITGNLSGSVGSVATGGITAASIATDAIDADALAADAVAEIADAVWDEVITGAQHNINTSAAKFLREASATITGATGTAQAGGASTITLEAGASATDQLYQWERISIIDGTGVGQAKLIVDYNGTTKVATVNSAWAVQPDNTSVYAITGADVVVDAIDNQTVSATAAIDFDDLTTLATDWADGGRLDLILDGVSTLDAAGVRTAVGLAAANLDTQLAALQTDLDTVTDTGVTCVALTSAAVEDAFSTYAIAEAYHADGAAGTPAQLLYFTMQALTEFAISGTTVTVKKLDGSTTAGTFTLDDATTPTSRTRAT